MGTSDEELMQQVVGRDRRALEALATRWSPRILELARRFTGDPDRARDIHQQAFLRLWSRGADFSGRASFDTWIYRVVLNLCRDARRRERTQENAVEATAARLPQNGVPAPDAVAESRELSGKVAAAVGELPDEEREVVMLKHYGGLSFPETARVLDIPVSTAKSRMGRALDRLKRRLGDLA